MNVHRSSSSLEMSDELNKNDVSHLIFLTKGYQLTNYYYFCSILIDFDQEKLVSFYNENRRKKTINLFQNCEKQKAKFCWIQRKITPFGVILSNYDDHHHSISILFFDVFPMNLFLITLHAVLNDSFDQFLNFFHFSILFFVFCRIQFKSICDSNSFFFPPDR